ncbi:hypothetical protein ACHAWF_016443 [Thalassiosira exigua]
MATATDVPAESDAAMELEEAQSSEAAPLVKSVRIVDPIVASPSGSSSTKMTAPPSWTDSTRSNSSLRSNVSSASSDVAKPGLRDNLMRRQRKDRNPMNYYETIHMLGVGSMGSVTKVKKRESVIGGSARQEYVDSIHGVEGFCFSLPIVGHILRWCTGRDLGQRVKRDLFVESPSSVNSERDVSTSSSASPAASNARKILRSPSSALSYAKKDMYFALKTIHFDRVTNQQLVEELQNEIDILKSMDHPNIVRALETYEYRYNSCIVLELCEGGDLYMRDPYSEDDALRIVTSLLSAVEYMHYLIRGDYDQAADLWSIGVIAFMLLSSQMPFFGKTQEDVVRKILNCGYVMRGLKWTKASKEAKAFVQKLLVIDPSNRPSASKALQDEWISPTTSALSTCSSEEEIEEMQLAIASMDAFAGYSTLKKLALMVLAHKSTSEEIGFLKKIFKRFDRDHNGDIGQPEFQAVLEEFGFGEEEIINVFLGCDMDGSGMLHYTEFLAATIEAHGSISEEALSEAFDRIDSDDSGYISTQNLREILGEFVTSEYIEHIILEAESELDYSEEMKQQLERKPAQYHFIAYEEFMALWDHQKEDTRMKAYQKVKGRRGNPSIVESRPMTITISENEDQSGSDSELSLDPIAVSQFQTERAISVRKYADI